MAVTDFDLRHFIKQIALGAGPFEHVVETGFLKSRAREGMVIPQRSPTAISVTLSSAIACRAKISPSATSGRVCAFANSGPAATMFGLIRVRPVGRSPSVLALRQRAA